MTIDLRNRRVLVVGLAKSGVAAARLLVSKGARVTVTDEKPKRLLGDVVKVLPRGVKLRLGTRKFFGKWDLIIISPGVPWKHPELVKARKKRIPVWGELELGWRFVHPAATVAITGTNGKTTTTALLGEIVRSAGRKTVVGGNIGAPLSGLIRKIDSRTTLILEVSSYQLESQQTFHPNVGAFLNLTPDHLKRHGTMAGYARAKARLFQRMTASDTAVLNRRDSWCRRVGRSLRCKKVWFPNPSARRLARFLALPGEHNQENAMAAIEMARALGLSDRKIVAGLKRFGGVPHRIQTVREKNGVLWVNDSKSTNVDSTQVALKAFRQPLILILGGQHKGAPYTPLLPALRKRTRLVLTIGEAAPLIEKDLKNSVRKNAVPVQRCVTLSRAVSAANTVAKSGQVVLLSPACASFDQFKNFEHRGETFARLVRALR